MPLLKSAAELRVLLAERPEHDRTYQVDPVVAAEVLTVAESSFAGSGRPVRRMTAAEAGDLADYLGTPAADLHGNNMQISVVNCEGCGRLLSMLDFAKTASRAGSTPGRW